jgi:hypothetical protein
MTELDVRIVDMPPMRVACAHGFGPSPEMLATQKMLSFLKSKGLENIGEVWKQLILWFEDSPYRRPPHWHECLENLLVHPDTPYEEYVFDLHLAISG